VKKKGELIVNGFRLKGKAKGLSFSRGAFEHKKDAGQPGRSNRRFGSTRDAPREGYWGSTC